MRPVRKRIFMVAILVLSQVAALAVLAGALWLVKAKEAMGGSAAFTTTDGRTIADIFVSSQDAKKVDQGSIIFGNTSVGSFTARVLYKGSDGHGIRLHADVLKQKSRDLPLSRYAQPIIASMWTRNRRAITILLDRSSLEGEPAGGTLLPMPGGQGNSSTRSYF